MKLNIRLIALGLCAFVIFLIVSAPATLLTGILSSNAPVEFNDVSGTVWHGQAMQITAQNIVIGPVEWTVHPWYMLRGELAGKLVIHNSTSSDNVAGSMWLSFRIPGVLKIRDTNISADAEWAFMQAAVPIAARGRVLVHIEELQARKDTLPKIVATLSWQNAGVSYPQDYSLGSYEIKVQHQPENDPEFIVADISDQNSPLHVNGQARLNAGGEYQLNIKLSADPDAPADITRVLPLLGTAQDDGSVNVQRRGQLNEFL
jgi:general secretion pathway protein N